MICRHKCKFLNRTTVTWTSLSNSKASISLWKRGDDKKEPPAEPDADEVIPTTSKASVWSHLTPEQVMKIRNKSRLPRDVVCELKGIPEHGTRLTHIDHLRRDFVKAYFAKYGKASGLIPGVCWPSKEELEFRIKYEETFQPTLETMLQEKKAKAEARAAEEAEYRKTIIENLKKLPQAKAELIRKYKEKKEQMEEEVRKRERVIQEVREYLGYDVAPGDTRFQEALTKKEEEEAAVLKQSKKQERQAKLMAELSAMAEEQIKKAAESFEVPSPYQGSEEKETKKKKKKDKTTDETTAD